MTKQNDTASTVNVDKAKADLMDILREHGLLKESTGSNSDYPFQPGDKVLIRTVTMIQTGEIVSIGRDWIELKDAAWIANTMRFHDTLKQGDAEEVEPIPGSGKCVVGRGAVVDIFEWNHPLLRTQK